MPLLSLRSLAFVAALVVPLALLRADDAPVAAALPAGVERVTSVEGITEYAVPNGLHFLLFPDPSRPIVTVNITYKVGSRHEGYGETGMAHLLEHMVFKGTPQHPNIPQELTEHGARANGTTWMDRTNYYETVAATEENLRWALELEADRMVHSHIARADLEKEFSVVRNEYERGENSPAGVLNKRMLPAVFQWHNYGHSTIGEKSDIEGAPIERLQAFYRNYYQPDNAVLVVAGRFDEAKTLALIASLFGPIPKPARAPQPTYTREPTQDGERQVTLRRSGDVQIFSCIYRACSGGHPDHAPLTVLAMLLTDEPSGRLYKELVETKKAASVSGDREAFAEGGIIEFAAQVRLDKSLDDVRATMLAVLDGLKNQPPTEEEVARTKARLLKGFEMSQKQSDRLALRLSESIALGDWRLLFLNRDRIEQVTAADVARVAAFYLKPANRTLGFFIPDTAPDRTAVPETPDLTAMLKDYHGKPPLAPGEDFEASPANIEKRTARGQLENGLKFALLPKKTRGEAVSGTITLRFGTLESLANRATAGEMTASLLDKGTQHRSRQEIKDTLDRLKARVSIGGGASSVTVGIETDRAHLAETLRLVRELLREPAFPADEFDKLKQEQLAALEQQMTDPSSLASNRFTRLLRPPFEPSDPRYTRTLPEEVAAVEAVTLEQVRAFYESFYGANHATAAIVGDFEPGEIQGLLRETLGDWRSPSKYSRITWEYESVPSRTEIIRTPDKANAVYLAGFGFRMRDDDPEYPAVAIGGYMLGGGFLNSRLAVRIRQKEGLSYGVRGGFAVSALDRDASFTASMIYNPQNVAKLSNAFREEIERAARDGFTAAELEAARTGWLKSREVTRSNDGELAGTLSSYLYYGRDLGFDAAREENVRQLSLEQVNAAMRKYLDYSRMVTVKAGAFSDTVQ